MPLSRRQFCVAAVSAGGATSLVFGQNEATFSTSLNVVDVLATVRTKKNEIVRDLTKDDFVRILTQPQNALTKQTIALLGTEGVDVTFTDDSVDVMAQIAYDVNRKTANIGARRLYTILERVFETISFDAPELPEKKVKITGDMGRAIKMQALFKRPG